MGKKGSDKKMPAARGEEVKKENLKIVLAGRQAGKKKGARKDVRKDGMMWREEMTGKRRARAGVRGRSPRKNFWDHALFLNATPFFKFRATPFFILEPHRFTREETLYLVGLLNDDSLSSLS